jgi:hypothetical protein
VPCSCSRPLIGRRRIYPSTTPAKVVCCGETVGIRTEGIGVIATDTVATPIIPTVSSTIAIAPLGGFEVNVWLRTERIGRSTVGTPIIPTVISTMAMTPLGGFELNVWLRTEGIGVIAIGTVSMSITPEITAMVAVMRA